MQILIVTENKNRILKELGQNQLEFITVTGIDSLNYIGINRFFRVIIDCADIQSSLHKLSLGIHDDSVTSALWKLLSGIDRPEVLFLVEKSGDRPSSDMINLGVSFISISEIKKLSPVTNPGSSISTEEKNGNSAPLLTADDIRLLHNQGKRTLPAGARLTSWAAEVADSLNLKVCEAHQLYLVLPLNIKTREDLVKKREHIFATAGNFPQLFFLINPLFLPVFNEMFPALTGRTVAPSLHWESHGAFTGETSASMLSDMRCFGAVLSSAEPYKRPEYLKKTLSQAKSAGLKLFSTFTLASPGTCDIIATDNKEADTLIPLYPAETVNTRNLPESGAILINEDFLKQLPSGKEIRK